MHSRDKINKAAWNLLEGTKDVLVNNITDAMRSGKIKVEASTVNQLLALVNASLDAGFHRGNSVFEHEVNDALRAHLTEANLSQAPSLPTKKK